MSARLICCLAFFTLASPSSAQEATTSASSAPHSSVPTEFDSFIVVLLVRPPNAPDLPKPELEQLQEKHLANIGRLAKEGKVLKAGPFEDYSGRNVRGMADSSPDPALVDPVVEYTHFDGVAVIGGYVYRGSAVPALAGMYVFGEYGYGGNGRLFYCDLDGALIKELRIGDPEQDLALFLKGIGEDENGELYALGDGSGGGLVEKMAPIAPLPSILNLSTRLRVETGDNVLVSGFIITGSDSEEVVLRGLGPSLSMRNVAAAETLLDPAIELFNSSGALIASNDGWVSGPQASEIIGLGLAPGEPSEAALLAKLPPGGYTAILRDAQGGSGVGIVELYATSPSAPANPVNISTRGLVGTGDDLMIGGFIIGGMDASRLVIRALGQSLSGAGIANALLDPTLELHDQEGDLIAFNDNWKDIQQPEVEATGLAPTNEQESAILATLSPAPYTAIVRGKNETTGVAIVEVYKVGE